MRIRLKKSIFGGELQAPPSEEDLLRKLFLATVSDRPTKVQCPLFSQRLRWAAETAEALGAGIFRQKDGVLVKPLPKEGSNRFVCCREDSELFFWALFLLAAEGVPAVFEEAEAAAEMLSENFLQFLSEKGVCLSFRDGEKRQVVLSGKLIPGEYFARNIPDRCLEKTAVALCLLSSESVLIFEKEAPSLPVFRALEVFGVRPVIGCGRILLPGGGRFSSPLKCAVEGSYRLVSPFLCAGAFSPEGVTVKGLPADSLQKEESILGYLSSFGAGVDRQGNVCRVRQETLKAGRYSFEENIEFLPLCGVLACQAKGESILAFSGNAEERAWGKRTEAFLKQLGAEVRWTEEGLVVVGSVLTGGILQCDAECISAAAVASALCPVEIEGAEAVASFYPSFFNDLALLGPSPEVPKEEQTARDPFEVRQKMDELDEQIVRLLSRRIVLSSELAQGQKRMGGPVLDEMREKAVLERVSRAGGETGKALCRIYESIFSESRRIQRESTAEFGMMGADEGLPAPRIFSALCGREYILFDRHPEEILTLLRRGKLSGVNVAPSLRAVILPQLDEISPRARSLGTVNTVVRRKSGSLSGHNTDCESFAAELNRFGIEVSGKKCVILGVGPLSEAVKTVLLERNARTVQILFPEREVLNRARNVDLLLNTVGAFGDRKVHLAPLPAERLSNVREVLDLTALEQPSGLLLEAWARDIPAYGGLYMFIEGLRRSAELFLDESIPKKATEELYDRFSKEYNR